MALFFLYNLKLQVYIYLWHWLLHQVKLSFLELKSDIHLMQLSHSCQSDKCYKTFPSVTTALAKIATPPSPSGTQLDALMEQCTLKLFEYTY